MATKRAYKLQEFVAHASNVNCAKFGRRTSRILITGGEDLKVNLWAVGKPSALLSLSGLTSPIESVSFDSSELTIGAGSASGTIKIWDVEEAKGKIASMYNSFDAKVSKIIWDLTAGKLLHDFSLHEGPVNCLDFHPHEFLLATGSADKTLKFWDLETFELIGSSGPENSREYFEPANVVRSMKFNSDGKTLFCGLHECLKVLSWEPIICHDVVDVGWSTLADLTVDEGKLLGCSYNQNCIGVWVVDLMKHEPYADNCAGSHLNGSVDGLIQSDNSKSAVLGRLPVSTSPADETGSYTLLERSMSTSKEIPVSSSSVVRKRLAKPPGKRDHQLTRSDSAPLLSPRVRLNPDFFDRQKRQPGTAVPLPASIVSKVDLSSDAGMLSHDSRAPAAPMYKSVSHILGYDSKESPFLPVLAPRHSSKGNVDPILSEAATDIDYTRRAPESTKGHEHIFLSKPISSQRKFIRKSSGTGDDSRSDSVCPESVEFNEAGSWSGVSCFVKQNSDAAWNTEFANTDRNKVIGMSQWMESSGKHAVEHRPYSSNYDNIQYVPTLYSSRLHPSLPGKLGASASDEDDMYGLMENHQEFIDIMKYRLTKLEVVYRCWQRNDIRGSIDATWRMMDCVVTTDIINALMENSNHITLDICASLLRLSSSLLESKYDRHLSVALGMILSLVKSFGATIYLALSAAPPVGVDLEAEQRSERCSLCFQELKKASASLKSLTRRQGEVGRLAQELAFFLQDILQLSSV
ncbi:hypothetical protein PVAP13_9KG149700 [Panicum virgatum]|uniref:Katanin p80 WD40 repeat-containing subunit B1 homolog n=1 Tax=Panicum virgatum TaxID=38727 RepID=A0A8T0NJ78_PANVG|nr:hypothetical protein PVAP13_9KG149700 [Panicum virgatum]